MFKARLALEDLDKAWRWQGQRWAAGGSWIEPYHHPALAHQLIIDHGRSALTFRERLSGASDEQAGDHATVELGRNAVTLSVGERGVAPLYLTARAGSLLASWDLADLRSHLSVDALVEREVARLLAMRFRYGHDTVFAGVYRLTERSTAVFDRDGLRMRYPQPALHTKPRQLRDGADVLSAYECLLDQAIAARSFDADTACVELSGGLDSANVAATLGARHPGRVVSAALMLPGQPGAQQARRRAPLIERLRLAGDVRSTFPGRLPLAPTQPSSPLSPYADPYDAAKLALVVALRGRGVRMAFTGIGGDELVALTSAEVPKQPFGVGLEPMPWIGKRTRAALEDAERDTAPPSVINEMTLIAQACAAPTLLRAGIWPVHPLADPTLIRFGEWLPIEWRRDKRLHRARLQRLGCPEELVNPPLPENFTPVMRQALMRHGPRHLTAILEHGSPLIETGFLDPDGLAEARQRLTAGDLDHRDTELYGAIALDLALRSFTRTQETPTAVTTGRSGCGSARRASPVTRNPPRSTERTTDQP